VSNALRRLREVLGDDLVVRSGHGVEPTQRALALWPPVREALAQLQESLAPGLFEPTTATSTFVLAMSDATAATLVPGLVEMMEREAPGISVRVVPLTTRDPRRLLEEESADMAVGYFPAVLADLTARAQSGSVIAFDSRRIYDGEYVCVMRQGHPLANSPLTLDQFCASRHMLVSFSGRPFGFIDEALASLGRVRRVVLTVNQFFTAGRVVASSLPASPTPWCCAPCPWMCRRCMWMPCGVGAAPSKRPSTGCCWRWHALHGAPFPNRRAPPP
jgi:DNA-binding transcriptional LysR family regulator